MASELVVQTIKGPSSGSNANTIIVPAGQTVQVDSLTNTSGKTLNGDYVLGKVYKVYDSTSYSTSSARTFVDGPILTNLTGFKGNSLIELFYHVPGRNDSTSWGGMYVEPNVSFDNGSTYSSLGHTGYDVVMVYNSNTILSYNNTIWINPNQTADFTMKFKFRFCSYDGTTYINGIRDINDAGTETSGSNSNFLTTDDSHLQHFFHIIVKEWRPIV